MNTQPHDDNQNNTVVFGLAPSFEPVKGMCVVEEDPILVDSLTF